jgi:hypothetical protein
MVRALVEYMLGPSGMAVLHYYESHSLVVNGIIVLYGALLTAAHLNLRRLKAAAIDVLRRRVRGASGSPSQVIDAWDRADWERILRDASRFPLVAQGLSLAPRRSTASALAEMLPSDSLIEAVERAEDADSEPREQR